MCIDGKCVYSEKAPHQPGKKCVTLGVSSSMGNYYNLTCESSGAAVVVSMCWNCSLSSKGGNCVRNKMHQYDSCHSWFILYSLELKLLSSRASTFVRYTFYQLSTLIECFVLLLSKERLLYTSTLYTHSTVVVLYC